MNTDGLASPKSSAERYRTSATSVISLFTSWVSSVNTKNGGIYLENQRDCREVKNRADDHGHPHNRRFQIGIGDALAREPIRRYIRLII